jgi:hypothetical protein
VRDAGVKLDATAPLMPTSPAAPAVVILNEGFEGVWPSTGWTLFDTSNADGGEFLWDDENCYSRTGSYGGYSHGGGANGSPCWVNYPNNMLSWALYGPIDLSGASAASMTYYYHGLLADYTGGDCTFDIDIFYVAYSVDGINFDDGILYCGAWADGPNGRLFYRDTLDLSGVAGNPAVWVAFLLTTNGSGRNVGMMIDDISIDVGGGCATPGALTLTAPGNGSSTADTTPTFNWSAASNATDYQLMVDNNSNFSSPEINLLRGGTQYTPGAALAPGTYYWGVRGHNAAGGCDTYGPWTNAWSFTITAAPTCYLLTLDHTGSGGNPTATPASSPGCANGRYIAGQPINLTASPANGWRVNSWQGTNNNGSSSISNTATMPAGNHTVRVNYVQGTFATRSFLPSIHYGLVGWVGPFEVEPNNDISQANGPMVIGRAYQAYPNDRFDFFYFELGQQRTVVVTMVNNVVVKPQLRLTPPGGVAVDDTEGPEFKIVYPNAPPGRYYIRTAAVNNNSNTVPYTLQVTTP